MKTYRYLLRPVYRRAESAGSWQPPEIPRAGEPIDLHRMMERAAGRPIPRLIPPLPSQPMTTIPHALPLELTQSPDARPRTVGVSQPEIILRDPDQENWVIDPERVLGISADMSDKELRAIFRLYRQTHWGKDASSWSIRLGRADRISGQGTDGDTSIAYVWATVHTDGRVKRVENGSYYRADANLDPNERDDRRWRESPITVSIHETSGYRMPLNAVAQKKLGRKWVEQHNERMRQARPFPDQATLADTLFVAPSGIGGPGLAERAKTQRDTAKPLPSGKQSAPSNQPKSPEQSSEAHSGKRFARTVSDAVNDGQITPEEAKNILARFEMESGNVSAAARKQWYALDLSVRKNLQSILQVNQDGGIARRGDGETIGAIRKIAES